LTVSFKAELLDNFASPVRPRHHTKPASIELKRLVNPAIARHIHESFSGTHLQASMSGRPKPTAWQCQIVRFCVTSVGFAIHQFPLIRRISRLAGKAVVTL